MGKCKAETEGMGLVDEFNLSFCENTRKLYNISVQLQKYKGVNNANVE